jgi:hypothetical protein
MTIAGPLLMFGAFLLGWVWMSRHPEHALTRAFYMSRFRTVRMRPPADDVLMVVAGWALTVMLAAAAIAVLDLDPVAALLVALGALLLGGLATLIVAAA